VSGQPPLDLDAVARLANAVRSRHCEPGADGLAYNLAQAALRLVAEVERLHADLAAARTISEHRMESAKAYAATVDILSADLRRIAAERDALVNLRDAAVAWREMRRGSPVRPKPESAALIAAVDALPPREGTAHRYLSTGCLHGEHDYCAGKTRQDGGAKEPAKCKFCEARCVCSCHGGSDD
jgi:hypothetical protein